MNKIEISLSAQPITGLPRKMRLTQFRIEADLEMTVLGQIIMLTSDGNEIYQQVANDTSLSDSQRLAALSMYKPTPVSKTTRDSKVSADSGEPTTLANGVSELAFFQGITIGSLRTTGVAITDETPIADIVYALISQQLQKIDSRQQV